MPLIVGIDLYLDGYVVIGGVKVEISKVECHSVGTHAAWCGHRGPRPWSLCCLYKLAIVQWCYGSWSNGLRYRMVVM